MSLYADILRAISPRPTMDDVATSIEGVLDASKDGWFDIDEEWSYASATTITVPTGAASRFQIGDKIRLTQTTVKYFYVVGVADTVLTVTGGSDYTVANAAISAVAYSRVDRPFGFPSWFNYTPTFTGFSANPTVIAKLQIQARTAEVVWQMPASGTSNAATFTMSAPVTAATITNMAWHGPIIGIDNGARLTNPGRARMLTAGTVFDFYSSFGTDSWTASGNKSCNGSLRYEI